MNVVTDYRLRLKLKKLIGIDLKGDENGVLIGKDERWVFTVSVSLVINKF